MKPKGQILRTAVAPMIVQRLVLGQTAGAVVSTIKLPSAGLASMLVALAC
jgi:hypothetical protein